MHLGEAMRPEHGDGRAKADATGKGRSPLRRGHALAEVTDVAEGTAARRPSCALLAALEDAERYRWLRHANFNEAEVSVEVKTPTGHRLVTLDGEKLDLAIDDACRGT